MGTGVSVPQISGRGDSHAKVPTLFWHTIMQKQQVLQAKVWAYRFMRVRQIKLAIQLAPRMHQNLPFWAQKSKKKSWGGNIATSPDPFPRWVGDTPYSVLTLHPLGAFGASFLALAMIRPHFLNRGYAPAPIVAIFMTSRWSRLS